MPLPSLVQELLYGQEENKLMGKYIAVRQRTLLCQENDST